MKTSTRLLIYQGWPRSSLRQPGPPRWLCVDKNTFVVCKKRLPREYKACE